MDFDGLSRLGAFRKAKELLAAGGAGGAESEAKLVISGAINGKLSDVFLYGDAPLKKGESRFIQRVLRRRLSGMPLQYAMNTAYFMGLKLYVDARVLIPRPETELLAEHVLEGALPGSDVLDLCTGSGCIAIAIAKISGARVTASDRYQGALDVARRNAMENGAAERVEFVRSDMFQNIRGFFDTIVSNPPYIPDAEWRELDANVRGYEPKTALKAGDGFKYYRIIAREAKNYLKPGGRLAVEIGYNQREAVSALFEEGGYTDIHCKKDLNGIDRIVSCRV